MDRFNEWAKSALDWLVAQGPNILGALILFVLGHWIAKRLSLLFQKVLLRKGVDAPISKFLQKISYYSLMTLVVISVADQLGIETTPFLALLAASGLAIGLSLKDYVSSITAGLILLFYRPFRLGDFIQVSGTSGVVKSLSLLETTLVTPDHQKVTIPNSKVVNNVLTNSSAYPTRRIELLVRISYEDDLQKAKKLLQGFLDSDERILTEPTPSVTPSDLAEHHITLAICAWVQSKDVGPVRADLIEKIKTELDQKELTLPIPQQKIQLFKES